MIVSSTILAAFKTSKFGSKASNCADSFAISPDGLKIAIADGVSKSYMPKFVADALTEIYVSDKFTGGTLFSDNNATELLSNVVEEWDRKSHAFETSVDEDTAYDLEYQRELYGMGASTFAGICMGPKTFAFDVLGDSCIFLIPKDKSVSPLILSSMPCEVNIGSDIPFKCDFGIHPHFIDTKGRIVGEPLEDSIKALDCTILLATDAFSDWFCRNYMKEDAKQIIDSLKGIGSQESFDSFIDNLRDIDLKNDDVAIVLVDVRLIENESSPFNKNEDCGNDLTSEANDGKSTFSPTDKIEGSVEDSKDPEGLIPTEEDINVDNPTYLTGSNSDELASAILKNSSGEIVTDELTVSEKCKNIAEPDSEDDDNNITGGENISIDITGKRINQKYNLISRVKKCLGLN